MALAGPVLPSPPLVRTTLPRRSEGGGFTLAACLAFAFNPGVARELRSLLQARTGHFLTESGYHGETWYDLDALFADIDPLRPHVRALAGQLQTVAFDIVCGPQTGGARLAALLATECGVTSVATSRLGAGAESGLFRVRYELSAAGRAQVRGRRVALVDDVISAGSAVRASFSELISAGAEPVVLGALAAIGPPARRFADEHRLGYAVLASLPHAMWLPEQCPLCRAGVPLERV